MTASLETLVIAACVFADRSLIPRPGPSGKITDAELVALAVAQAAVGVPSDRQFLGLVARLLPGWFPHLPEQTQYNRRLRRLTPSITLVQQQVAELVAVGSVRIADGTLIGVANLRRLCQPQRVRWYRRLRLLRLQEPVRVGDAARPARRRERGACGIHARGRQREGVRARA